MALHHYLVFGLVVRSDMPLPELVPHPATAADVTIRIDAARPMRETPAYYHVEGDTALLTIKDVGQYRIEGGRDIIVVPVPGASERNLRLYVLGSALGAVLHQRGLVPLHANAVEIAGAAVAFMGHAGAGKSTLAAWFLDRGHAVLTDDVCVIENRQSGIVAHRGVVRLRLWREAVIQSGRAIIEANRSFDHFDKYDVRIAEARIAPPSLPLGGVVLLERADEGEAFSLRRLRGSEAVEALVANVYRGEYAQISGTAGALMLSCVALANQVPVMVVRRAWGFDSLNAEGARIEVALTDIVERNRGAAPDRDRAKA